MGNATITPMNDLIAGYARHLTAAARSKITIGDRQRILCRVDADLPMGIEEATVEELEHWLAGPMDKHGQPKWSAKTKLTYFEAITAFFDYVCDPRNPQIDYNPAASLARPTVHRNAPHPVDEEEYAIILDRTTGFWRIASLLGGLEGFRCAEIADVRRERIGEDYTIVLGKGNKEVALPTHPAVWAAVRDFPRGPIALHLLGREISANVLSSAFARKMRAIGLHDVHLHRLRARFATMMLRPKELGGGGFDLRTVQELMRHADPAITALYTQVTDEQRRLAIATLPVPQVPAPC